MKICIPITAPSVESALARMEVARPLADLIEIRIDRIPGVNLARLLAAGKEKILVTNRRREEGGGFGGTEKERIALLQEAVELGAGYVDVEASTGESGIRSLKRKIAAAGGATKLIVSHHNLDGTPGVQALRRVFGGCASPGADIVKIVTLARKAEDNLRVLGLIPYARRRGVQIAAFCMGEQGRISRVAAPLLGSCLTYASLEQGGESAPGQMTVGEMKRILKSLEFPV